MSEAHLTIQTNDDSKHHQDLGPLKPRIIGRRNAQDTSIRFDHDHGRSGFRWISHQGSDHEFSSLVQSLVASFNGFIEMFITPIVKATKEAREIVLYRSQVCGMEECAEFLEWLDVQVLQRSRYEHIKEAKTYLRFESSCHSVSLNGGQKWAERRNENPASHHNNNNHQEPSNDDDSSKWCSRKPPIVERHGFNPDSDSRSITKRTRSACPRFFVMSTYTTVQAP